MFASPFIKTAAELEREQVQNQLRWEFTALVGQVIEMQSGSTTCALSYAADLIHSAQLIGEPCAWISANPSLFFPPDFAAKGIDLDALAIIEIASAKDGAYCAERLLKSGGFGCVVLDLGKDAWVPLPMQKRIAILARKERATMLYLVEKKEKESHERLGSSTQILANTSELKDGRFQIQLKKKGRLYTFEEEINGTPSLR